LLLGIAAAQAVGIVAATATDRRRIYARAFEDFKALTPLEFDSLVLDHKETPVELMPSEPADDGAARFEFTVPEDSAIYLEATAGTSEFPFVHPLIIQLENGRRYLLPLIRSARDERPFRATLDLGRFEAGTHSFTLRQDAAVSFPVPASLRLQATRPESDSLLAAFMDRHPVVKLKNLENVLDDIPLVGLSKIHRRENRYRVTSYIIFSSENGGTMPVSLMQAYQRTVDIEWVMQQLFEPTGDAIATRPRFQRPHHRSAPFRGREALDNRPVVATATPNNNFSDDRIHLWRWSIADPFAGNISDPIYYAPKPMFLAPHEWPTSVIREYPEMQDWSLIELALEGCVDLDDREDPVVDRFARQLDVIKSYLHVDFFDRGCRHKLRLSTDSS
jgi:hypothetical protein